MVVQLEIDGSYGWVLIVFATSVVVHNLVFGRFVGKARMKYKINFPIMYADPKECENAQGEIVQKLRKLSSYLGSSESICVLQRSIASSVAIRTPWNSLLPTSRSCWLWASR